MKNLYYVAPVLLFMCSCLGYKELPVEYDYSYSGNFKKYRTFDIMRPVGLEDTTMTNDVIEKSIISRMKFLGYKQSDHRPHLIIGFKMYKDSLRFNGYNQPAIEDWIKSQKDDIEYDRQKYQMTKWHTAHPVLRSPPESFDLAGLCHHALRFYRFR
ncbi:MAG: DUF4136 domain-containing protein [Bacteroidota bacterium]